MGYGIWLDFYDSVMGICDIGSFLPCKLIAGGSKKEEQIETALDILKKRYTRGEISKEEFGKMKKEIL